MLYQEIKQSKEPDSEINQILEITDKEFGITMFDMLNDLMEKTNNILNRWGIFSLS